MSKQVRGFLRRIVAESETARARLSNCVFCEFTEKEAAEALDISGATLKRDWAFAKGFILRQLTGEESEPKFTGC